MLDVDVKLNRPSSRKMPTWSTSTTRYWVCYIDRVKAQPESDRQLRPALGRAVPLGATQTPFVRLRGVADCDLDNAIIFTLCCL